MGPLHTLLSLLLLLQVLLTQVPQIGCALRGEVQIHRQVERLQRTISQAKSGGADKKEATAFKWHSTETNTKPSRDSHPLPRFDKKQHLTPSGLASGPRKVISQAPRRNSLVIVIAQLGQRGRDGGGAARNSSSANDVRNVATPMAKTQRIQTPAASAGPIEESRSKGTSSSTTNSNTDLSTTHNTDASETSPKQLATTPLCTTKTKIRRRTMAAIKEHSRRSSQIIQSRTTSDDRDEDVNDDVSHLEAADKGGRIALDKLEDVQDDDDDVLPRPMPLSPGTGKLITYAPGQNPIPDVAYLSFIVYGTTTVDPNRARRTGLRHDTKVWIAILSVSCFLVGVLFATIICYTYFQRRWIRWWARRGLETQSSEDSGENSSGVENEVADLGESANGSTCNRTSSTCNLLTDQSIELLASPDANLLRYDFLAEGTFPASTYNRTLHHQQPCLHRSPNVIDWRNPLNSEGAHAPEEGDDDIAQLPQRHRPRRPSRIGSSSSCSRSSASTCSTILTLDERSSYERRHSQDSRKLSCDSGLPQSWGLTTSGCGSDRRSSSSSESSLSTLHEGPHSFLDWTTET